MEESNLSGSSSPHEEGSGSGGGEVRRKKLGTFKRQLSKVDMILKFQPRNNKRSSSVFYADKECLEESPPSLSPEEELPVIRVPEAEDKPERPTELPLFEERPIPPPRKEKKETPKRDTRLLSVPNIKYHVKSNQGLSSMMRKRSKLN